MALCQDLTATALRVMMRRFKNTVLVLVTGYIFVYFSEHLFWARPRPEDSVGDWIATWITYSLLAYVFLLLVSHFRVKSLWALFLAGAAFGWMTEGIVVQTVYEALPLSISFTGLAWHALITIWVGWYGVRQALFHMSAGRVLKLAALIGIAYGFWAINWWLEPDGGVASVPAFAVFAFGTTALAVLSFWLAIWSSAEPFIPKRWVTRLVLALFTLYFCFVTVPANPIAVVVLPPLLGAVVWALCRNRQDENAGSLLDVPKTCISVWHYATLFALPATGTCIYALAQLMQLRWHTNWILYVVTTPAGFILFGVSLHKTWRRKRSKG